MTKLLLLPAQPKKDRLQEVNTRVILSNSMKKMIQLGIVLICPLILAIRLPSHPSTISNFLRILMRTGTLKVLTLLSQLLSTSTSVTTLILANAEVIKRIHSLIESMRMEIVRC